MAWKTLLLLMLMVSAIISGCATAPTRGEVVRAAIGQNNEERSTAPQTAIYTTVGCHGGPKYFDSKKDCEGALQSGECSYYTPVNKAGYGSNPVDGKTKFAIPIEEPVCAFMRTVNGDKWVAQPTGTEFRFTKKKDGTFSKVPYALHACGNKVMDIYYPEPKKVVTPTVPPPAQTKNVCTENGFYGDQYFPGVQGGEPVCFEKLPWYAWENLKTPVLVTAGTVIVAGAVYCVVTKRCWVESKKPSSPPPSSPPPSSPPPSGPVGSNPIGGPIGGLPIF